VFIECGYRYRSEGPAHLRPVGETEAVAGLFDDADGDARTIDMRIVAHADLLGTTSDIVECLEAHVHAGAGRLSGIRHVAAWDSDIDVRPPRDRPGPGLYRDPRFLRGLGLLKRFELVFDAWAYHTQLHDVTRLAQESPQTRIVIDHCGGPLGVGSYAAMESEVFSSWRSAIEMLSRQDNVVVKFGGFGMHNFGWTARLERAGSEGPDARVASVRPWFEVVLEAFGTSRCMLESNFPVDGALFSYDDLWQSWRRLVADLSADEQAEVLSGTARRTYGFDVRQRQ
jgi:predicted TIM-barrel fold metal-dependent hydrolase